MAKLNINACYLNQIASFQPPLQTDTIYYRTISNHEVSMIELPQGYYLENFTYLIEHVESQYHDLLTLEELNFCKSFKSLSQSAKLLYVRMLTRKGIMFRESKLNYEEIPNTSHAANALEKKGFITIDSGLDIADYYALFSKSEWITILSRLPLDEDVIRTIKSLKRSELNEVLFEVDTENPLFELIDEPIYRLLKDNHFETFKLLFFGNLNQDLTEFVLKDLGLYRFEDYQIDAQSRLFESRQQIEQYLNFYRQLNKLDQISTESIDDLVAYHHSLPSTNNVDSTLSRRIQRINIKLARQLERLDALDQALAIYQKCRLTPARERQARILVKQNKPLTALKFCETIIADPSTESEELFAQEFGARVARKHKAQWQRISPYKPFVDTITIPKTDLNVEIAAKNYFANKEIAINHNIQEAEQKTNKDTNHNDLENGNACFYVENSLFLSLFGLIYWNVIFAPVKGAFTNPLQYRPHDLYEDNFLDSRQSIYQQANQLLDKIDLTRIKSLVEQKRGITNPFVFWDCLSEQLLEFSFSRIPKAHLVKIFDRLWRDLRENRNGFPDLILFPQAGGYELIEIKGPGDKIQKNQLRWMKYFHQHQIPHKVVNVEWN